MAAHDLEVERIEAGEITFEDKRDILRAVWEKGRRQVLKDYVVFPLLAGPVAPFVLAGNASANLTRNVWSFMIIFCGHFPEGVEEFTEEEVESETRGGWYLRQMLGSANLTGGRLFHLLSGNLSHQIEHHLFPDIPAHRYGEIAVQVREICDALRAAVQHRPAAQAVRHRWSRRSFAWRCPAPGATSSSPARRPPSGSPSWRSPPETRSQRAA